MNKYQKSFVKLFFKEFRFSTVIKYIFFINTTKLFIVIIIIIVLFFLYPHKIKVLRLTNVKHSKCAFNWINLMLLALILE